MFEILKQLADKSDLMPHGYCFVWDKKLLWMHVGSDIMTGLAYYLITGLLLYFIYKRRDTPFNWIFILFGTFIFLCGTTHFFTAWTVYVPSYYEEGVIKIINAFVSMATAIILIPLMPRLLILPSLKKTLYENEQLNNKLNLKVISLEDEIKKREQAESDRKKLEEQLRQSQKLETIGRFAGGIAHDFNNILSAIINYGYMLRDKQVNEEQRHNVKQILDSADRAARLTADLLAFSRKQVLISCPIKINEIIKRVEKLVSRIIGEHIDIKTMLTDENLTISADSAQIEQVLMNLATNARDAMPEGGTLTIETSKVEIDKDYIAGLGYGEPGEYVLISVTDTGVGMDEKTRERIFEPFYTTKDVGKGTGLGLSIIYGIIKQHNGYINVYSEPGMGTTIKIYLPVTGEKVKEEASPVPETITKGTETILLAEDDEKLRIVTKKILESSGYKVIEAVDGEDAVEKFKENKEKIQLLIFDSVMPKKSGKKAYEVIRKTSPDIRVLFISGYTEDSIVIDGVLKEDLNFISKPVAPNELLKKIRAVLTG